jgi:hypothetical protein
MTTGANPMAKTASEKQPVKKLSFEINGSNISMNWKFLAAIIVTLLGGSSGYAGWQLVSRAEADRMHTEISNDVNKKHIDIEKKVGKNTNAINGLTVAIESVQTVQHRDVAFREAERLVEQIKCRTYDSRCQTRKNQELERIRRLNMRRLGNTEDGTPKPLETCATLECNN